MDEPTQHSVSVEYQHGEDCHGCRLLVWNHIPPLRAGVVVPAQDAYPSLPERVQEQIERSVRDAEERLCERESARRREYIATAALNGLAVTRSLSPTGAASLAVEWANALIAELDKG